jgi:S1-C subfamily serine protease
VRALTDADVAAAGLPKAMGLLVTKVEKGSIAEDMDMQVGDVVLQANGADVGDVDAFGQLVRSGTVKSFRVWRKGQKLDLTVSQSM